MLSTELRYKRIIPEVASCYWIRGFPELHGVASICSEVGADAATLAELEFLEPHDAITRICNQLSRPLINLEELPKKYYYGNRGKGLREKILSSSDAENSHSRIKGKGIAAFHDFADHTFRAILIFLSFPSTSHVFQETTIHMSPGNYDCSHRLILRWE